MRALLAFVLFWLAPSAFAGYAQLTPPPGFSSVGGVSTIPVGAAANGARYAGGHVLANASLNLGARAVTVPVGMRVAANAATFAVTKMNPWIAGLSLVAAAIPYILDWFRGSNLSVDGNGVIIVPGTTGPVTAGDLRIYTWEGIKSGTDIYPGMYCPSGSVTTVRLSDQCSAGGMVGWWMRSSCAGSWSNGWSGQYCGSGAQPVGASSPTTAPTEADFVPLGNAPINPALFPELGIPLPVDPVPIINPAIEPVGNVEIGPNGNPASQLQPSPYRIPNGDPVPIPNTNPQSYSQPWLEVHPSPTVTDPWRVDVRPIVTETTNPNPLPDPTTPVVPPDFYTDCEKFPGSLGCMSVGDPPSPESVPTQTRTITQQQGPTFGGAGCPANLTFTLRGQTYTGINMAEPCSWVSNLVRPVVLLLAFISAVGIVRSALKG